MIAKDHVIAVSLYLRGDDLNPDFVSEQLHTTPSRSQHKGEKRTTSTNREYHTKVGAWVLTEKSDTLNTPPLSIHIENLASRFGINSTNIRALNGVQDAFFDVFSAKYSDDTGGGICEFELSKDNLATLAQFELPILFTAAIVNRNMASTESQQPNANGFLPGDKGSAEWGRRNGVGALEGRFRYHSTIRVLTGSNENDVYCLTPSDSRVMDDAGNPFLDIPIEIEADEDGEGTFEFKLSMEDVASIAQLGFDMRFTVKIINN